MAMTSISSDALEAVICAYVGDTSVHTPTPYCGTVGDLRMALRLALVCKTFRDYVAVILSQVKWQRKMNLAAFRQIKVEQACTLPTISVLDNRATKARAHVWEEKGANVCKYAEALFKQIDHDNMFPADKTWGVSMTITNKDALYAFGQAIDDKILPLLENVAWIRSHIYATEYNGSAGWKGHPNWTHPNPNQLSGGIVTAKDLQVALSLHGSPYRRDGVFRSNQTSGVSVDDQLLVVRSMAHRAGIPWFDEPFTTCLWAYVVDLSKVIVQKACLLAASGLHPTGSLQYDDASDLNLSDDSDDSCSDMSDDSESEDDCVQSPQRWKPILNPSPHIAGENGEAYLLTPTQKCIEWASQFAGE